MGKKSEKVRVYGEGSVYRSRGGWAATLTKIHEGKRRKKAFYVKATSETAKALEQAKVQIDRNIQRWLTDDGGFAAMFAREAEEKAKAAATTLRAFVKQYCDGREVKISRALRASEYSTIKTHILPSPICDFPLDSVTKEMAESYISNLKATENTKATAFKILKAVYKSAIKKDLANKNVWLAVEDPPKFNRPRAEGLEFEAEGQLRRAAQGDAFWHPLITLALDTGLRRGEIFGLQAGDINWRLSTITVRRVVECVGASRVREGAKTPSSLRTISVGKSTLGLLREHLGPNPDPQTPIFTDAGELLDGSRFNRAWKQLVKKAGLPSATKFHGLRHTVASSRISAGDDALAVSERLGHSKMTTTLNIYAHATQAAKRRLADAADEAYEMHLNPSTHISTHTAGNAA